MCVSELCVQKIFLNEKRIQTFHDGYWREFIVVTHLKEQIMILEGESV